MLFNRSTFIGIDPTSGKRPISYAALDNELRLLALDEGDIDEVTAFVGGQENSVVAVNSPRRPNQGVMARPDVRESLSPVPRPGRWIGFRLAEYQLRQYNIRIPRTPASVEECRPWIRIGFDIYRRLERMGFQDFPDSESQDQLLEAYPHAVYCVLLEHTPFKKRHLIGRVQRQLVLHSRSLEVPDPMRILGEFTRYRILQGIMPFEGLCTSDQLDALAAAYTAWKAATHPDEIISLGDVEEGQIILPVAQLKPQY